MQTGVEEGLQKARNLVLKLQPGPETVVTPKPTSAREAIEVRLSKEKLKMVRRMQNQLEQKLQSLNKSVELLAVSKHNVEEEQMSTPRKQDRERQREEFSQKREEAQEFARKLKLEQAERLRRNAERQRQWMERVQRETEEDGRKQQEQKERQLLQLKTAEQHSHELLKRQREEARKSEERLGKAPDSDQYLYKVMEQRFQEAVLLPTLEQRKQELLERRNMRKMVSKQDLALLWRKHNELIAERSLERHQRLKQLKAEEVTTLKMQKEMRTSFGEKINQEDVQHKEQLEQKRKETLVKREKRRNYANLVKEMHPISTSNSKAAELQQLVELLKHPVRENRNVRGEYNVAKIWKSTEGRRKAAHSSSAERLNEGEGRKQNVSTLISRDKSADALGKVKSPQRSRHQVASVLKTARDQQKRNEAPKRPNYLQGLHNLHPSPRSQLTNWESALKNDKLTAYDKFDLVTGKVGLLEERARRKEQLLTAKGGADANPDISADVSAMLIDAIKGKLAILEHF